MQLAVPTYIALFPGAPIRNGLNNTGNILESV